MTSRPAGTTPRWSPGGHARGRPRPGGTSRAGHLAGRAGRHRRPGRAGGQDLTVRLLIGRAAVAGRPRPVRRDRRLGLPAAALARRCRGSAARPAGAEADRGGTARPAARAPPRGLAARRRGPDRRRSRPATPGQPGWPAGGAAPRAGAPPPGARTGGRELVSRWRGSGPASSAARRPTRSPSAWRTPCRPRDRSRLGRTWPLPALHPVLAPDTDPPSARPARPARTRCHPAPATSLPPSTGAGDPASTIRASRAGTREPVRSSQVRVVRRRFLRGG